MSVAYVIHFTVRDGQRERFLELLTDVLHAMAHEANYRGATLHECHSACKFDPVAGGIGVQNWV